MQNIAVELSRGDQDLWPRANSIVILLHDLPLGGSERIALRLANAWAALGRQVTLFVGVSDGPLATLIGSGVELVECDPPIPRGPGSRRQLGEALSRFIGARNPDLVFLPGNYQWPALPALAPASLRQMPIIVAQISTPLYRHGRGPLRQLEYNYRMYRRLRPIDAAVSLTRLAIPQADRILGRRITRAIPLPALDDEPTCGNSPAEGRLIVAAGRLVSEKGFDQALRAFTLLKDPMARMAIVGSGPELGRLQALAVRLGIGEQVEFPGYVADLKPWLARARVFLLSSWYEGYAAVVIEALAAGRPVVATDCTPAASELLTEAERGLVAPLGDAAALAAALKQVLAMPAPDPARLAAAVERFRIGPISRDYLKLFDELFSLRSSSLQSTSFSMPRRRSRLRLVGEMTRRLVSIRLTGPARDSV